MSISIIEIGFIPKFIIACHLNFAVLDYRPHPLRKSYYSLVGRLSRWGSFPHVLKKLCKTAVLNPFRARPFS